MITDNVFAKYPHRYDAHGILYSGVLVIARRFCDWDVAIGVSDKDAVWELDADA